MTTARSKACKDRYEEVKMFMTTIKVVLLKLENKQLIGHLTASSLRTRERRSNLMELNFLLILDHRTFAGDS